MSPIEAQCAAAAAAELAAQLARLKAAPPAAVPPAANVVRLADRRKAPASASSER